VTRNGHLWLVGMHRPEIELHKDAR
jgi:hypothetical protein